MRDFADVSMNLHPKLRASSLPSAGGVSQTARTNKHERTRGGRTFNRDFSLSVQIALVSDDDHREVVLVLDAQYLLLESLDLFKGLLRGDGVDEQEAFASAHVLFSHSRVFFLSCCVEHIEECDLIVDDTLLAV